MRSHVYVLRHRNWFAFFCSFTHDHFACLEICVYNSNAYLWVPSMKSITKRALSARFHDRQIGIFMPIVFISKQSCLSFQHVTCFSSEVIILLVPSKVYLLQGNHDPLVRVTGLRLTGMRQQVSDRWGACHRCLLRRYGNALYRQSPKPNDGYSGSRTLRGIG